MNDKLKPCPFCGSKRLGIELDELSTLGMAFCVLCKNCLTKGPMSDDDEIAIDLWNRRAEVKCDADENRRDR